MRSIFLKIFAWFWLAIGIVIAASAIVFLSTDSEPLEARWREVSRHVLAAHAYIAGATYTRSGQRELNEYLDNLEANTNVRAFLFDQDGRELSGRPVPPGAVDLAKAALASGATQTGTLAGKGFIAWNVKERDGRDYVFLSEVPGAMPPIVRMRFDKRIHLIRLLTLILTGGFVCYGLALYLTRPIRKLREASQQLAAGKLDARVGPSRRHDELAELGRDFDVMAERIENLVTGQQRLLSDVSHELRSPLARLGVALELARKDAGRDTVTALNRIERESSRLNELVGQLLGISRLESGTVPSPGEVLDLNALLASVIEDARFEATASNKEVIFSGSRKETLTGSRELWRQAIENIVRNAVRYAKQRVEVELSDRRIVVRDDGPGVGEKDLKDIFRPFYRVDDARDRESGGVGLGLAIAERALRLQGGSVSAHNYPSGGLEVVISLP